MFDVLMRNPTFPGIVFAAYTVVTDASVENSTLSEMITDTSMENSAFFDRVMAILAENTTFWELVANTFEVAIDELVRNFAFPWVVTDALAVVTDALVGNSAFREIVFNALVENSAFPRWLLTHWCETLHFRDGC